VQVEILSFSAPEANHFDIKGSLRDKKRTGLVDKLGLEYLSAKQPIIERLIERSMQVKQEN
jgi:hypothetical protein